jgi:ABC-type lipoprotein release transport system permease subunit
MRLASFVADVALAQIRATAGRSCYLVVTIAVTTTSLLGLAALDPPSAAAFGSRQAIFVTSARSGGGLPLRYVDAIGGITGVSTFFYSNYLPVFCASGGTATLNGYAGPGLHEMLESSYVVDAGALAAWDGDPLGVLVGEKLARQCGWTRGMNIRPRDGFRHHEVDIHVIDTIRSRADAPFADQLAIAHYDYLDRQSGEDHRARIAGITVLAEDAGRSGVVAAAIDARFAHADPPTQTTLNSDAQSGLERFGRIEVLVHGVMAAVLGCAALVTTSILAHAAVQRAMAFAMLRALGFRRRALFAAFAAEFLLLAAAGVMLGSATGVVLIAACAPVIGAVTGSFAAPEWTWRWLPAATAALLGLALVAPARVIANVRPSGDRKA